MKELNVSCGISGLTINPGDKVVVIPLKSSVTGSQYEDLHPTHVFDCSKGYSPFYKVAFAPVSGTWTSGGLIMGLLADQYGLPVAKYFNTDIYDLINHITDYYDFDDEFTNRVYKADVVAGVSAMLVREDVYVALQEVFGYSNGVDLKDSLFDRDKIMKDIKDFKSSMPVIPLKTFMERSFGFVDEVFYDIYIYNADERCLLGLVGEMCKLHWMMKSINKMFSPSFGTIDAPRRDIQRSFAFRIQSIAIKETNKYARK